MRLARTLIGMVHLAPLPGSPRWAGSMPDVVARAVADARALADNGVDALIVGTWVKRGGDVRNPVDPARVRTLVESVRR